MTILLPLLCHLAHVLLSLVVLPFAAAAAAAAAAAGCGGCSAAVAAAAAAGPVVEFEHALLLAEHQDRQQLQQHCAEGWLPCCKQLPAGLDMAAMRLVCVWIPGSWIPWE